MNLSRKATLSTAVMAILSGCSDRSGPAEPVGRATAALAAPTSPNAGMPLSTFQDTATKAANPAALDLANPNEKATLRGIALEVSSRAGVSSPKTMHAVAASDHQAAESILSGATIKDHAPVYVITMTGGPFTATHHPRGIPAPQGGVLRVTVDAATHRVTDVGYVNDEPDLTRIGPLTVDL